MCLRIVTDNVKFKTAEEDMTFYKVVKHAEQEVDKEVDISHRFDDSAQVITFPHYVSPYQKAPIVQGELYAKVYMDSINRVYDYGDEISDGVFHLCKTLDDAIKTCAVIECDAISSGGPMIPLSILKATIPKGADYIEGVFPILVWGVYPCELHGGIIGHNSFYFEVNYTPSVIATDMVRYGEEVPIDLNRLRDEMTEFLKEKGIAYDKSLKEIMEEKEKLKKKAKK